MVMAPPRPRSGATAIGPVDIVRAVESPDAVLMARMAAGDEEALGELWHRYGPLVYGHARRLTASRALAEDVAQEVFVSLWTHPGRFDPARGTLRAYLAVHARRRAIDALRRDSRRASREQRHSALSERERIGIGGVADGAEHLELAGTIKEAIDRLPTEQRDAVRLAYFDGLTHCEVAAVLGIPEGTAKSRLRLAQGKLRAWLGPVLEATS